MILALAGGVGGAKLVHGLASVLAPGELVVAVNTGDDFTHLGLHISPDLDSVVYKLAGRSNPDTGWGHADETWHFMAALERLGGETWFRLGDKDLATHVERTRRLAAGEKLSAITADFCRRFGIEHTVTPMSDDPVRTMVISAGKRIAFQDYFVRLGCAPVVAGFEFDGIDDAAPAPALAAALGSDALTAMVICPSNPFVSTAPILSLPAMAAFLKRKRVPVIAVSPIVAGAAVRGPAAKMMAELGLAATAAAAARYYDGIFGGILDGFVIDDRDRALADEVESGGVAAGVFDTIMENAADEARLARHVLDFAAGLELSDPERDRRRGRPRGGAHPSPRSTPR
jgi:LPPG:FO 2-phospho-L-lactate transferase